MINDNEIEKKPAPSTFDEEEKRKYYEKIALKDALLSYSNYYVYEENKNKWIQYVFDNIDNLKLSGDIMSQLGRGMPVEEVSKLLNGDDLKPEMIDFTLKTILQFSKRGPEFFRANCDLENNRKIERIVRKIEKKNAKYQRNEEKRKEAKSF